MPSHDFEKQVQQKMEELRLAPSEAVWKEVAKQIPSRKKRRRALLWWLLLPLLAGAGFGIYRINSHSQKTNGLSLLTPATTPAVTTGADRQTAEDNKPVNPSALTATRNNNSIAAIPSQRLVLPSQPGADRQKVLAAGKNPYKAGIKNELQPGSGSTAGKDPGTNGAIQAGDDQAGMQPAGLARPGERLFAVGPVTALFDPVLAGRLSPESIRKADSAAALKKASPPKKMEWVVTAGTGVSGIVTGLSSDNKNYASSAFYANPGGLNITPGTAGAVYYGPSGIRQGIAFNLGLSLRRDIGRHYSVEAGIAYSYYTTTITIGGKVDSIRTVQQGAQRVTSYYLNNGSLGDYTNNYQFVEIPIRLRKQLGRSPVSVNTGVSIGRFVGSNAMQYDSNLNLYYKNNSLFNKTQLNVSAAFDIRLWQKKPVSLELGPRLQYGVTNLSSKAVYGSHHLLFGGLELRVSFGKK